MQYLFQISAWLARHLNLPDQARAWYENYSQYPPLHTEAEITCW